MDYEALYPVAISAMAANRALAQLCGALASRGVLDAKDIETLRHQHLIVFDIGSAKAAMPGGAQRELAEAHATLSALWDEAAQAVKNI